MSAGIDSCALLAKVQLKADQAWADNATRKDYIAKVGTLTAIRENQTARLADLENPMKDNTVTLYWEQQCDETVSACSDECSVGGAAPETGCQDHTLDLCYTSSFTINEKTYRTVAPTMEEAVAKSMLKKVKALDEKLAQLSVAKLNTSKGVNAYTGGKGTVSGFSTTVGAAYWNASLFSYFALVAEKNKFLQPYIISGTNLFEADWNAKMNMGNADGKGAAAQFDSMKKYFDVFNIDTQLDPEKATFMVDGSALAFVSKNYYKFNPGSPESNKWGGVGGSVGMKYQFESKNLPGVFYDVTHKVRCSSDNIYHDFTIAVKAGLFRNPVGCTPNNTGILKFLCS